MGQGCNSNCGSWQKTTPDNQIQYTGPAVPSLGICTGDLLSEVEGQLIQTIVNYATGVGITMPNIDLTACNLFSQYVNGCGETCIDLPCLMNIIFQCLCTLYTDFVNLQTLVNGFLNTTYDTACLSTSTFSTPPTFPQIFQELILEYCALADTVAHLVIPTTSTINTLISTFLANAIANQCQTQGLTTSGTGTSLIVTSLGHAPIGSIIMWDPALVSGSAAWWDSNGTGRANTPACGFAFCDGNSHTTPSGVTHTTRNMVGLAPIGTTDMGTPPGGLTPPSSLAMAAGISGQYEVTLTSPQCGIPSGATVSITDPGHQHILSFQAGNHVPTTSGSFNALGYNDALSRTGNDGTGTASFDNSNGSSDIKAFISRQTTGITGGSIAPMDAPTSHNNVQPVQPLYFIQRLS